MIKKLIKSKELQDEIKKYGGEVLVDLGPSQTQNMRKIELSEENGKKIGINITGLPGTDLPYNKKKKHLLRFIQGTSYSTPIRVGKIALNDMMEGII